MLSLDRRKYIMDQIKENGSVKVDQLADELNVTQMTIRRDLDKLESENLLQRTHGGAILYDRLYAEEEYDVKKEKNIEIKKHIAKTASEIIIDQSTIYLDAGTTTYELAMLLKQRSGLIIVTGDLKIASLLYPSDNDVYVIGGKIEKSTGTVIGAEGSDFLSKINIDYAFVGTSAVSHHLYASTPTFEKADLKKHILKVAHKKILLVDRSKFCKECFVKIAPLTAFDIVVTDKTFDQEDQHTLDEVGVDIKIVKEGDYVFNDNNR